MKKNRLWIALTVLAMAALACNALTNIGKKATATPADSNTTVMPTEASTSGDESAPTADTGGDTGSTKSEFPLPENISNFIEAGGVTNFQTKMSLKDVMAFYKDAFAKAGYTERTLLTVTTDTTFSMVFDGHKSGKAIAVQCVDLGDGNVNVSISLQDI